MGKERCYKKSRGLLGGRLTEKFIKEIKTSDKQATYEGIMKKCMYFMFMIAVGAVIAIIMHVLPGESIGLENENGYKISEAISLSVSLVIMIIGIVGSKYIPERIPLFGSLVCVAIGYMENLMSLMMPVKYGVIFSIVAVLTCGMVFSMQVLYFNGKIRVTSEYRKTLFIVFNTWIWGGIVLAICSVIPELNFISSFVEENAVMCILMSAIGIVIASNLLIYNFDVVRETVEDELPEEYEWIASYSLCMAVILLYIEILQLVTSVLDIVKKD